MSPTSKFTAVALAFLALSLPASQQTSEQPSTAVQSKFTPAQIEQMVAPIALHPDALLSQILMGSTYPIEIVQAQRWVDRNPGLAGSALEEALKAQEWDPSVKALCGFPTVLKQMNDNLDWTRDLGDAFLGQKTELMDAVQRMRRKALDAGTLKTMPQQKVVQEGETIVIEPASPEVVYVPAYSPLVVYGAGWYYPYWYYPYWYYPPPYGGGYVSFGVGFWWGSACWSHCDWHHHGVFVDAVAFKSFTTRTCSRPVSPTFLSSSAGQFEWTHDPEHRKGVAYRSPEVGTFFNGATGSRAPRDGSLRFDPRGAAPRPATPSFRQGPGRERHAPPHRPSKHDDRRWR